MLITQCICDSGLDMKATCDQIGKLINESGLNDKQLGKMMNLSVQSINKWRHGHNLPDIENMYLLSRILGKSVDDFLVPVRIEEPVLKIEIEMEPDPTLISHYIMGYFKRFKDLFRCALSQTNCNCSEPQGF